MIIHTHNKNNKLQMNNQLPMVKMLEATEERGQKSNLTLKPKDAYKF